MFERMSLFPSGCTAAAAEDVCRPHGDAFQGEDVVDPPGHLVDQSLVVADHRTLPTRFRMLEDDPPVRRRTP